MLGITVTGALLATGAHAYDRHSPGTREARVAQVASAVLLSAVGHHALHWKMATGALLAGCAWRDPERALPIALSISVALHAGLELCWKRGAAALLSLASWGVKKPDESDEPDEEIEKVKRISAFQQRAKQLRDDEQRIELIRDLRQALRSVTQNTPEADSLAAVLEEVRCISRSERDSFPNAEYLEALVRRASRRSSSTLPVDRKSES